MSEKRDSEIEQWVLREFGSGKNIESKELCVSCCDCVVTLAGSVEYYRQKIAAGIAALRAPEVTGVINHITLKPCMALIERRFIAPAWSSPPASGAAKTTVKDSHQFTRTAHQA